MTTALQTSAIGAASYAQAAGSQSLLGKDDFLKLLITQLRYQDPLNPLDGTEFASQLAQFSSVEQLANINSNLEASLDTNQLLTQSIGNSLAATMIGKEVRAAGDAIQLTGGGEVRLGYTLASVAASAEVKIYDANGTLVRTLTGTGTDKGDNRVVWDGKDDQGASLAAGSYTFSVKAVDGGGTAISSTQFLFGTVSSVRFKPTGTVFVVDGAEIPLSQILEILNGTNNG